MSSDTFNQVDSGKITPAMVDAFTQAGGVGHTLSRFIDGRWGRPSDVGARNKRVSGATIANMVDAGMARVTRRNEHKDPIEVTMNVPAYKEPQQPPMRHWYAVQMVSGIVMAYEWHAQEIAEAMQSKRVLRILRSVEAVNKDSAEYQAKREFSAGRGDLSQWGIATNGEVKPL